MKKSARVTELATKAGEPYCPDSADLVWLDFDPQVGREQAGRRPGFVLSPRRYNQLSGLMLACPVTSQQKGYSFEVVLPDGLPVGGVVLADQLKSVSWMARKATFICSCRDMAPEVVGKLETLVSAWL